MDRNENIPKSFCYRAFLEKVNECFLVCFAQRAVSDRILKKKGIRYYMSKEEFEMEIP